MALPLTGDGDCTLGFLLLVLLSTPSDGGGGLDLGVSIFMVFFMLAGVELCLGEFDFDILAGWGVSARPAGVFLIDDPPILFLLLGDNGFKANVSFISTV